MDQQFVNNISNLFANKGTLLCVNHTNNGYEDMTIYDIVMKMTEKEIYKLSTLVITFFLIDNMKETNELHSIVFVNKTGIQGTYFNYQQDCLKYYDKFINENKYIYDANCLADYCIWQTSICNSMWNNMAIIIMLNLNFQPKFTDDYRYEILKNIHKLCYETLANSTN